MSGTALLDVNVLIALFDPGHVHHEAAHDWFADNAAGGWATCPVTQAGFVRVLSAVAPDLYRPSTLITHLRKFCSGPAHHFWPDALAHRPCGLRSVLRERPSSDRRLPAGLARKRGGRLATFDRTIPVKAVVGARRGMLAVIAPAS